MPCNITCSNVVMTMHVSGGSDVTFDAATGGTQYDGTAAFFVKWTLSRNTATPPATNWVLVTEQCNDRSSNCGHSAQSMTDTFSSQGPLTPGQHYKFEAEGRKGSCSAPGDQVFTVAGFCDP